MYEYKKEGSWPLLIFCPKAMKIVTISTPFCDFLMLFIFVQLASNWAVGYIHFKISVYLVYTEVTTRDTIFVT